jgi:hypothetical protein
VGYISGCYYRPLTEASRVADPDDPRRVFEWLLEQTRHELGHIVRYTWRQEDLANAPNTPAEAIRSRPGHRCTYAHLHRVDYGNATPFVASDFAFSLVFDYGDHVLRRTPRPHPRPAFDGTSGAARTNEKAGEVTLAGLA